MDWLADFLDFTAPLRSPAIFRRWAGLSAIASVLQRRVWTFTQACPLYPNLYIILVSPAGIGKGMAIRAGRRVLSDIKSVHIAPTSVTFATLATELAKAEVTGSSHEGRAFTFHAMSLLQGELGILVPAYDNQMMNKLIDLWDGQDEYSEERITRASVNIRNPCLNIIAGTTIDYLNSTIPKDAWYQGFLARTSMVFSGEESRQSFFEAERENAGALLALIRDLRRMQSLHGAFSFTTEAMRVFDDWANGDREPVPYHYRMVAYNTRRPTILLKMMQLASANRGLSLSIDVCDFETALSWMIEAEATIPEIFKASLHGGNDSIITTTHQHVYEQYMRTGFQPVPEATVKLFLAERTHPNAVEKLLSIFYRSGVLERLQIGTAIFYKPTRPP